MKLTLRTTLRSIPVLLLALIAANAIASNVEQIAQMTEETAATIHANAESAAQLQEMAGELRDQVAYFKVSR